MTIINYLLYFYMIVETIVTGTAFGFRKAIAILQYSGMHLVLVSKEKSASLITKHVREKGIY